MPVAGTGEEVGVIELEGAPKLADPVMVAAFEGWNDAGDAATAAVEHLEEVFGSTPLAAVDPEPYYDFQVARPIVRLDEQDGRRVEWPTTRASIVRPGGSRDLVVVRGVEPSMRWRSFCADVLGLADDLEVTTLVCLGALLADVPHTRPVPVSGSSADTALMARLDLEPSRYEGPTGIVGVLQDAATRVGLAAVSFWAAVPHYVAQPPCPKATVALLHRLEDLLGVSVPLGDLPEEAQAWEHGVDELAAEDREVADYVAQLEQATDATSLPEASGEAIAREFERYLRRRDTDGPRGA